MITSKTRLIQISDTGSGAAAYNMALDYALFSNSRNSAIRFYDWDKKSISIGYSQKSEEVIDASYCISSGIDIVRRPTGGGVVFHGDDITFTLYLSAGITGREGVLGLYKQIGVCVSESLRHFGIKADIAADSDISVRQQFCICQVSKSDAVAGGRKIGGGAIKWSRKGTLYQGYIQLNNNESWAGPCLSPLLKALYTPFDRWSTSVRDEVSWGFNVQMFKEVLAEKLIVLLDGQYEKRAIGDDIKTVAQINQDKYRI